MAIWAPGSPAVEVPSGLGLRLLWRPLPAQDVWAGVVLSGLQFRLGGQPGGLALLRIWGLWGVARLALTGVQFPRAAAELGLGSGALRSLRRA